MIEMQKAVDFALANREYMAEVVKDCITSVIGYCGFEEPINIAHNYAQGENQYVKNVIVHRKGATSAFDGELGIIPGSQGTSSYIVKGLGNPKSFKSCSHGAGRVMGRKQAQKSLDYEAELQRLDGIIHSIRSVKDLDEAPSAYKDIDAVMANQEDLVSIVTKLKPLGVIKG
jgi:tRNA-splicing ligase RtcB